MVEWQQEYSFSTELSGDLRDAFKSMIYHRTNFIILLLYLTASIDLFQIRLSKLSHICLESHKIRLTLIRVSYVILPKSRRDRFCLFNMLSELI